MYFQNDQELAPPKICIADLFSAPVTSILDVATGNGEWLRNVLKKPWVANGATVVGVERSDGPCDYPIESLCVNPTTSWKGLTIVHSLPEGSFDLIHEAFFEVHSLAADPKRFDNYERINRCKQFLFAHSHSLLSEAGLGIEHFLDWITHRGYEQRIWEGKDVPLDYPKSTWWNHVAKYHGNDSFLIAASKPRS